MLPMLLAVLLACPGAPQAPAPGDEPPPSVEPGLLPSFERIGGGSATVPLTVTVLGASMGQVDFRAAKDGAPLSMENGESELPILHVEVFTSIPFVVQVPAAFPDPITAVAIAHEPGRPPADGDAYGVLETPFRVGAEPLAITITVQPDQMIRASGGHKDP